MIIPALKPNLDHSLSENMTLCPVIALRYYLDKTKYLRQGNHLLFISFKNGLSGDIQRATISSWLKQIVMLAYPSFHLNTPNMSKVKAHDVCSTVSSLALKGGFPLIKYLGRAFGSHTLILQILLEGCGLEVKRWFKLLFGPCSF